MPCLRLLRYDIDKFKDAEGPAGLSGFHYDEADAQSS